VYDAVTDDTVLRDLIDQVDDPVLQNDLATIKQNRTSTELEPIQRRLQDFVQNRTVADVIDADESGVDFRRAIDNEQIVLVDVRKGEVGGTVSRLIGSIVVTKVWAAAQSRITVPEQERHPYYLYIDEVQNYAGEASSFASILGEAREYRLGCTVATQYLNKLDTGMRRAVTNNCRTKVVFDPSGSEDVSRLANMLRGVPKRDVTDLGDYRAVLQTPGEQEKPAAVVVDTYPPWTADYDDVADVKEAAVIAVDTDRQRDVVTGGSGNSGGDGHDELLVAAKQYLEEDRGCSVNLFYQEAGVDRPDGAVMTDSEMLHLEAENSTLSKPSRVHENLQRAVDEDRRVVFAVDAGDRERLERIVGDADVDVEYRILQVTDSGNVLDSAVNAEETACPELDNDTSEDELAALCIHREEGGYCTELGQGCVLSYDD